MDNTAPSLKIIVFGANGRTGSQLVQQALWHHHHVTAVVRRPELFHLIHPNLRIVKGDVLELASFAREVEGKDVVVSALGVNNTKPTVVLSRGVLNIMSAMEVHGVRRFIGLSSLAVEIGPDVPFFQKMFTRYVLQKILANLYDDQRLMERETAKSALDWTIVRPPMLTNAEKTGSYRVAINSYLPKPFSISRADVADFILKHLYDRRMYQAVVEVGY